MVSWYDVLQPRLIQLLGRSVFDEYAGKIYQLKFYEETAFSSAATDHYWLRLNSS